MKIRRIFNTLILGAVCLFGGLQANASNCVTQSQPLTIPYQTGSMSISYQICPTSQDFSSFYWVATVTYNNVSFDGTFSINGSMNMQLNYAAGQFSSIMFNGGPLTYLVNGTSYAVNFNNLAYTFNSSFQPISATGSLTINGQTVSASSAYWPFIFR